MPRTGFADANGMRLAYEDWGEPDAPAILLIMGLGAQLVLWPDAFVDRLVARGFRVVRFDNRDIGLSTKLDGAPTPPVPLLVLAAALGFGLPTPYRLDDMAADSVALLDALGIARAHIVGASMGGMIAQLVALRRPERTLSLTSIMSTSGSRRLPPPDRKLLALLSAPRPEGGSHAEQVAAGVALLQAIGTPDDGASDGLRRELVEKSLARSYYPEGSQRQLAAIIASGSRRKLLPRITAPTLVIHGTADRLVPPAGGRDVARLVPGARLELIAGMGHDLPPPEQPRIVELIASHAAAAQ